jgi:hypothetical protein
MKELVETFEDDHTKGIDTLTIDIYGSPCI